MPAEPNHPRYCAERDLPTSAYQPGLDSPSARPQEDSCEVGWNAQASSLCNSLGFRWAVDLFNHAYYWEAHEAWERLWLLASKGSSSRLVLQGLIQFAAAMLKAGQGQWESFASLRKKASQKFTKAAENVDYGQVDWDSGPLVSRMILFGELQGQSETPRIDLGRFHRAEHARARILREVLPSDLQTFYEQQQEPEGAAMAGFPSQDQSAFMLHWHEKVLSCEDVCKFAIVEQGSLKGYIVRWSQDGERCVGYWIGKAFWKQGVASRALGEFLTQHETRRPLTAYVSADNIASIRVLEKCGFMACPGPSKHHGELRFELL